LGIGRGNPPLLDLKLVLTIGITAMMLHELFEAQTDRTPDQVAVVFDHQMLTYGELNRRANQLAHHLRGLGVGPEVLVGLFVERSPKMLVGLLGILKAGGAYVPMDPSYPKERLGYILEDSKAPILLTEQSLVDKLPNFVGRSICLDTDWTRIACESEKNLVTPLKPDNLAYVLFTSGSTGRPKGVALEQRSAVNFIRWAMQVFTPQELAAVLFSSSVCFDLSVFEIFVTLSAGGKIILASNVLQLPNLPAKDEVTLINTVPSAMAELLRMGAVPASVKTVNLAGEALSDMLAEEVYATTHVDKVYNLYGPTETTTYSTYAVVRRGRPVTIGRPIANTQCYILDASRNPVPIGVKGELYLAGEGLARCYYRSPELTNDRFVPNPFSEERGGRMFRTGDLCRYLPDGNIEFLGRLDNQVKMRGFRIELGEIESTLAEHLEVSAAAVVLREEKPEKKRLVAYIVPHEVAKPPTPKTLRDFLKQKLPDYMVPTDFITIEALPLTPRGKLDRMALPGRSPSPPIGKPYVPPILPEEWQLVRIWEEILNVRPIGVLDNFFDLGGHSLLAIRMMDRIEDAYGKRLPIATLFSEATILHLTACLRRRSAEERESGMVPVHPVGSRPPFFFLHGDLCGGLYYRMLAQMLGPDQPFYGVMPNGVDGKPFLPNIEATAEENIRKLVALQPQGPYFLGGYCNGGLVAYEMARQMEQQGLEVGLVILLETLVPRHIGWLRALVDCVGALARLDVDTQARVYLALRNHMVHKTYRQGIRALLTLYSQKLRRIGMGLLGTPPEMPVTRVPALDDPLNFRRHPRFGRILSYYRPQSYQGRIVLLRTNDLDFSYPADRTAGWGKLAPQIEVHDLPGDHGTCVTEYIGDVAKHIGRCLDNYKPKAPRASAQDQCA
jgi:amino acid adenylation domain-containing protein